MTVPRIAPSPAPAPRHHVRHHHRHPDPYHARATERAARWSSLTPLFLLVSIPLGAIIGMIGFTGDETGSVMSVINATLFTMVVPFSPLIVGMLFAAYALVHLPRLLADPTVGDRWKPLQRTATTGLVLNAALYGLAVLIAGLTAVNTVS